MTPTLKHWSQSHYSLSIKAAFLLSIMSVTGAAVQGDLMSDLSRAAFHYDKGSPRLHPKSFLEVVSELTKLLYFLCLFLTFLLVLRISFTSKILERLLDICFHRTKFFRYHLDLLALYMISTQVFTLNNIKKKNNKKRKIDVNCFSCTL